jgi:hypothetical protein
LTQPIRELQLAIGRQRAAWAGNVGMTGVFGRRGIRRHGPDTAVRAEMGGTA